MTIQSAASDALRRPRSALAEAMGLTEREKATVIGLLALAKARRAEARAREREKLRQAWARRCARYGWGLYRNHQVAIIRVGKRDFVVEARDGTRTTLQLATGETIGRGWATAAPCRSGPQHARMKARAVTAAFRDAVQAADPFRVWAALVDRATQQGAS